MTCHDLLAPRGCSRNSPGMWQWQEATPGHQLSSSSGGLWDLSPWPLAAPRLGQPESGNQGIRELLGLEKPSEAESKLSLSQIHLSPRATSPHFSDPYRDGDSTWMVTPPCPFLSQATGVRDLPSTPRIISRNPDLIPSPFKPSFRLSSAHLQTHKKINQGSSIPIPFPAWLPGRAAEAPLALEPL